MILEKEFKAPTTRRLIEVSYICGICLEEHNASFYVTTERQTPEDLLEQFKEIMLDPEHAQQILNPIADIAHDEERQRTPMAAAQTPLLKTRHHIPGELRLTGESDYTCDECQATFQTIGQYRIHQGVNQDTARKVESPAMIPEALLCPAIRHRDAQDSPE